MSLRYSDLSLRELLLKQVQGESLNCLSDAPPWIQELASAFSDDLGLLALHGRKGLSEQLPQQAVVRVPLCAVDNTLLLLTRNAIRLKRHVGIAVPPGVVMMPMLIVCKTLLGDLLDQQEALASQDPPLSIKQKGGILLVSPDAEMRARYFSMRVGPESVVNTYDACRMRPDGSIAPFNTKHSGLPAELFSVCFFSAHQRQMPKLALIPFKPSVVILDLAHDRWIERRETILEWCLQLRDRKGEPAIVNVLLPFGDSRAREAVDKYEIPIFPLDSTCISELTQAFAPIVDPANESVREAYRSWSFSAFALEKPLERKHSVYYVPDEAASPILDTVDHIYRALEVVNDRQFGRDLRLAAWLVGTLIQLPIPVEWYEQHAYLMGNRQPLKKLISGIGNGLQGSLNAELAPTLQALRGNLDLLYTRLSQSNPKSTAFLHYYGEQVQPLLEAGEEVAIICRNDVVARALWPWMQSEGISAEYQEKLRILAFKKVDGRELFDHLLSTGSWPARYRWQLGGRLARTVDLLLYRGEETIIEQQLRPFYGPRAGAYFNRKRLSVLESLGAISKEAEAQGRGSILSEEGTLLMDTTQSESREGNQDEIRKSRKDREPEIFELDQSEPTMTSLFDVKATNWVSVPVDTSGETEGTSSAEARVLTLTEMPAWYEDLDVSETEPEEALPTDGPTEPCLLLKVKQRASSTQADEPRYLYVEKEGTTECYIPSQEDEGVDTLDNDDLESGFILIRTDQEDRRGLFERIVELADAQPTMKYLKVWRQHWLEAIDGLAQKNSGGRARRGTYLELQKKLVKAGVKVTTATVRSWVLGQTIGPGSLESTKAVGALSQHPMVEQYPEQIDAAFKQIRSIHQVLGRRISSSLKRVGRVTQRLSDPAKRERVHKKEVQLDPALSVPIDDLIDMLEFWEIIDVSDGPWQVPVSKVNVMMSSPFYGGE